MMRTTELKIINPLEYPGWDNLLLASRDYSFFHTSFWARVLHDSYTYRPCYLTRIQDGKLDILVPIMEVKSFLTGNRGVSLPFTDYCEPIIHDTNTWKDVLKYLQEYGKNAKWNYLELRGGEALFGHAPFSASYYRHILKLSADVDAIYAQVQKGRKSNITKAIREGVTITQSNTIDAVKTFYRLHCVTRKKHGTPPQPFSFFQRLYEHIISNDHGQVVLASYNGQTISGAVFLHFGNEVIYKFSASDSAYQHLRPNDLLMWKVIQWYCRNGYSRLDFGRSEPENEGLRYFKKGWGAEEYPILYRRYDLRKAAYVRDSPSSQGFHNKIFARLPVPILKIAGSLLYKHIG